VADAPTRRGPDDAGVPRSQVVVALVALVVAGAALRSLAPTAPGAALDGPSLSPSPSPSPSTTAASVAIRPGLDPGLVRAFDAATNAAAQAGHRLTIRSGYRTRAEQQQLLDAEIAKRGSVREALRWVFTPDRSMHVRGLAVDIGDRKAATWLDERGARFGLCRTLAWEWWHFEWRRAWEQAHECPAPAHDPSEAPT
jgi:hypothetical protein